MPVRARELIASLGLQPHPEGGFYREIHRSTQTVTRGGDGAVRSGLTSIYYLLTGPERGAWHRVSSDEVWHFYEGAALELCIASPDAASIAAHRLGPLGSGAAPVAIVAAGHWQAARSLGDYSLVGCSVGPGFDFADFALARDLGSDHALIAGRLGAFPVA
jgi:predicted cupin superfamily sugar epimerase